MNKAFSYAEASRLPFALLLVLMGLFITSRDAAALPAYRDTAKTTYLFKPGGVIDKAGCLLCHAKPTGGEQMNPYGASIKAALVEKQAQAVTPEILHSLDNQDADGDGVTNGEELKADTLPGDPSSHPAGTVHKLQTASSAGTMPGGSVTSPFDIKAAVLAPHAQHPVLVHFPIALFIISFCFDVLGLWRKNSALHAAAYLNLAVAALGSVAAVTTGLIAWQWQFKGVALSSFPNLQLHLIFGSVSCILISFLWFLRYRQQKISETPPPPGRGYLLLAFLVFLLLALTGHLGGFVSGING